MRGEKTHPVTSGFRNIFSDLLGRETERADLGSESGRRPDLTASGAEVAVEVSLSVSGGLEFCRMWDYCPGFIHDLHLRGI